MLRYRWSDCQWLRTLEDLTHKSKPENVKNVNWEESKVFFTLHPVAELEQCTWLYSHRMTSAVGVVGPQDELLVVHL